MFYLSVSDLMANMIGGASNITKFPLLKMELMDKLRRNPCRYRVGVTIQPVQARMWAYPSNYSNKKAYYAFTMGVACLKTWENEALSLLPANHPHNIQRTSNISPGSKGVLYIIDMRS